MPETYRVILTEACLAALEEIARYVRQDSPDTAVSVAKAMVDAIDSLETMPRRGRHVGTSRRRRSPVHALVARPFIIYYRIAEQPRVVYVLTVIHGRGSSRTDLNSRRPATHSLAKQPLRAAH